MPGNKKGQITVSLSLLFLVLSAAILCILDAMRGYMGEGMAREALSGAGEEVTANYDKALYSRYHLFFLDPRERDYIQSDAEDYFDLLFKDGSLLYEDLEITREVSALDQHCLALKEQIYAWMKFQKADQAKEQLKALLGRYETIRDSERETEAEITEANRKEEASQRENAAREDPEGENQVPTEESPGEDVSWKELKESLQSILSSGILLYAADDRQISSLQGDLTQAPSGDSSSKGAGLSIPSFSLSGLKELKTLLEGGSLSGSEAVSNITDRYLLLSYIQENLRSFTDTSWKADTALQYEKEYLIGGKKSDRENLNLVANRIFLLRFVMNYAYASGDRTLASQAAAIGAMVGGAVGMPSVGEAVKLVLLAALCYGEALLDLHTLFAGKKVPFLKDAGSWTLTFENAAGHLKNKTLVKEGKANMDYTEYLQLFTAMDLQKDRLCLRLADLMQMNVRLEEKNFLMKEALSSFCWEGSFQCPLWYFAGGGQGIHIKISGTAGYES